MSEQVLTGVRRQQILGLLSNYGPLSIRSLEAFLFPPIHRKRLSVALKRLKRGGLVISRNDAVFGKSGVYYQLAGTKRSRAAASQILSLSEEELRQPWVRHLELIHAEKCAAWSEWFKKLLPDATVIREHHFAMNPVVADVLLSRSQDFDLKPDVIIVMGGKMGERRLAIGIEVEKTQKSDKRILARIRKYVDGTQLDGVLYICDHRAISERIKLIYKSRVLRNALRIRHYGDHFFLFATGAIATNGVEPAMVNAENEPVSVSSWIAKLQRIETDARRDAAF